MKIGFFSKLSDKGKMFIKLILYIFIIPIGLLFLLSGIVHLISEEGPFGEYFTYRSIMKRPYSSHTWSYMQRFPNGKHFKEVEGIDDSCRLAEAIEQTKYSNCYKIIEYLKSKKRTRRYKEAQRLGGDCAYKELQKNMNWKNMFDFIKQFPENQSAKIMTAWKDHVFDSAIVAYNSLSSKNAVHKGTSGLFRFILKQCRFNNQQPEIGIRFSNEIKIGNYEDYKNFKYTMFTLSEAKPAKSQIKEATPETLEAIFKEAFTKVITSKLDDVLPGDKLVTTVILNDSIKTDTLPFLEIKFKIKNMVKNEGTPEATALICEYKREEPRTKTVYETKQERYYDVTRKEYRTRDVQVPKSVPDGSNWFFEGYYYLLSVNIECSVILPGSKEKSALISNYEAPGFTILGKPYDEIIQISLYLFGDKLSQSIGFVGKREKTVLKPKI